MSASPAWPWAPEPNPPAGLPLAAGAGAADELLALAVLEVLLPQAVTEAIAAAAAPVAMTLLRLLGQARGLLGSRGTDLESIRLNEVASGGVTAFSDQSVRTRNRFPDIADR
jgi:hypothetical protein